MQKDYLKKINISVEYGSGNSLRRKIDIFHSFQLNYNLL